MQAHAETWHGHSRIAAEIDIRATELAPALATQSHTDRKGTILSAMWKPTQSGPSSPNTTPEPIRPSAPATPAFEPARPAASSASSGEQATIGKGLFIKGEITGSESLYIDGKIEGTINLPGNRLTVGRNGQVNASINAREIVVLGKVRGNVAATDRVDIRAEGSLTGDVAAARISIEDGAFFKGGIDIRKPEGKAAAVAAAEPAKAVTV